MEKRFKSKYYLILVPFILITFTIPSLYFYSSILSDYITYYDTTRFPPFETEGPNSYRRNHTKTLLGGKGSTHEFLKKARLATYDGKGFEYIFFEHMRKSGGTTLQDFLYNQRVVEQDRVTDIQRLVFETHKTNPQYLNYPGVIIHSELRSFPFSCLQEKLAAKTLFVTLIRHPLERYQSEFVYSRVFSNFVSRLRSGGPEEYLRRLEGIGFRIRTKEELLQTSFGKILFSRRLSSVDKYQKLIEDKSLLRQSILHWMTSGRDNPIWKKRQVIGAYAPNMLVRYLSGRCQCLALDSAIAPLHTIQRQATRLHLKVTGCPEAERIFSNMTTTDLRIAKETVNNFDVAMPFEILKDKTHLLSALNEAASKKEMNFRFVAPEDVTRKKTSVGVGFWYVDILQFPDITTRLQQENALDIKLYQHVLSRYKHKFSIP